MSERRGRKRLLRVAELDVRMGELLEPDVPVQVVVLHDRDELRRLIVTWLSKSMVPSRG